MMLQKLVKSNHNYKLTDTVWISRLQVRSVYLMQNIHTDKSL